MTDIYIGGPTTLVNELKPAKVFDPLPAVLFLPEVIDPKRWFGGEMPYLDKDKVALSFASYPSPSIAINTELANGKYPLCIGASTEPVEEFLSAGAEIAYVLVKEGSKSSSGGGSLAIPSKRPHYNAASVFVNWLLSKDGMIVFSKSFGRPSTWLHKYLYDKISLYLDGRGVGEGEILA